MAETVVSTTINPTSVSKFIGKFIGSSLTIDFEAHGGALVSPGLGEQSGGVGSPAKAGVASTKARVTTEINLFTWFIFVSISESVCE